MERKSSARRRRCVVGSERGERIGAVGAIAQIFDHRAHVGTHRGKFALVLVETALGDQVGLARARRGKSLQENALGVGERVSVRGDGVAAFGGGVFELGADQSGVDAESLGRVVGKSVASDAAGDAADVGQEEVEGLGFGFGIARGKELAGALDEVILILGRGAESFSVGAGAALADVAVGIEAAFEGEHADFEAFFGEQGDGFFGGVGAGGVGIEVDDDAGGVAARAGATCASVKAVPLVAMTLGMPARKTEMQSIWPSTRMAPPSLADGLAGLIEIEEDVALGVERRLRRVEIFGAGFFAGFERARGEGDHAAAFVRDGEHDALAEARVERAGRAVFLLFPGEKAGGAKRVRHRQGTAAARAGRGRIQARSRCGILRSRRR